MTVTSFIYRLSKKVLPLLKPLTALDAWYARSRSNGKPRYRPLFIVGAPRSGTTILYQSLLNRFPLTYISNVEAMLFTTPALAHRMMQAKKDGRKDKGHSSDYGYVEGLTGPSEAGALMRFFLDGSDEQLRRFDVRLQSMANDSDRPVLSKNTFNSLRINEIYSAIPDAFVIRITRDYEMLHKSIMTMRKKLGGDEAVWIGAGIGKKSEIEAMSPSEQVDFQINLINDTLISELAKSGRASITVKLEDFLKDREAVLDDIMEAYHR